MQYTGSKIAFSIFGIPVYWYAIMIVIGMGLALYLAYKELNRIGGDGELITDLAMILLPMAIVGARLYYVIFEWDNYRGDFFKIIDIRSGGLAIHGGIIAGLIVGYLFAKKKKLRFFTLSDIIMIFLPLGQAIGRWGNFFNNEAFGSETDLPWALIIDGRAVHPTFLYESIGNLIIFAGLLYFFRKKQKRYGQTTALYLIFYGILRFFVEYFRTDSLWIGPIKQAQLISVVFLIIGIALFVIQSKKAENMKDITSQ